MRIDAIQISNSVEIKVASDAIQTRPKSKQPDQLESLIELALRNNPSIYSAENRWLSAQEQINAVRVIPDTVIGFAYSPLPIESRNGQIIGGVNVSQKVTDGDKLDSAEAVQVQVAEIGKLKLSLKKLEIEYAVKNAYYSLYYVEKQIEVQGIRLTFLNQLEKVINIRVKTGKIKQADLLKIQNEIANLKTEIKILEYRRSTINAKLNTLTGTNFKDEIKIDKSIKPDFSRININNLLKSSLQLNPGIKIKDAEVTKTLKQIEQVEASYNTDYMFGLSYQMISEANSTSPDKGKDNLTLSFAVNLALFSSWRDAKLKSAEFEAIANKYEKTNSENHLIAEIVEQYFKLNSAKQRYDLLDETIIPRAVQILNVTEQDYKTGKADFIELIEVLRNLYAFRLQLESSIIDYQIAKAALELFQGKSITDKFAGERNEK